MPYNPLSKEEKRDARKFWQMKKYREVFDLIVKGKTIDEIQEKLRLQDYTLNRILQNKYFNSRLKMYLAARLEDFQIKKIRDLPKVYKALREEFFNRLKKASDDVVIKEFLKFFSSQDSKLQKTDITALFMKFGDRKADREKAKVLQEEEIEKLKEAFGYRGELPISIDEQRPGNNQMDKGSESEDEQGNEN